MTKTLLKPSEVPASGAGSPKRVRILWRRCHRRAPQSRSPERTIVTLLRFTEESR